MLLVHGMQAHTARKCGEGIRIAAPDSNFGRMVGWRWAGARLYWVEFESTVDDQLAAHQCSRRGSCAQTLRTHSTRPQSQRTTRASALHTGPRFWTPVAPPVTAPGQLVQPVRRPLFLRDCKEPTYPLELGPLSLPGPALQALLALCISCLSRSSVCVCLPIRPWLVSTYRLSARYTERQRERESVCVSVCRLFNLFFSFLHLSHLPCHLAFFAYHHPSLSPLLLSTLSCRVARCCVLLLLLILLSRFSLFVKTISTHHSFPPPLYN